MLSFAVSCGARTELRTDGADSAPACTPTRVELPTVRSPECDEACSPPCAAYVVQALACNGTCMAGLRTIACWRHTVTYPAVTCLVHAPTGTLFFAGDKRENLVDRDELTRAGFDGIDDADCYRLRSSVSERCPLQQE